MSEQLLGAAIQGGIGVVSLVVLYLILKTTLTSLRADLRALNQSLLEVASRLGQLIGRDDPTPVRHAKEDYLTRVAKKAGNGRASPEDD